MLQSTPRAYTAMKLGRSIGDSAVCGYPHIVMNLRKLGRIAPDTYKNAATGMRPDRRKHPINQRIALDKNVPMQYQIFVQLRAEIVDGLWIRRNDFPTEAELAQRFGVSVITSRKALERLATEGWIERSRGRRTIAKAPPAEHALDSSPVSGKMGRIGQSFLPLSYQVLFKGVAIAPADACKAFKLPPGSHLWLYSLLRTFRGRPHSFGLSAVLPSVGARLEAAKLQDVPIGQILRATGISLNSMTRRLSASLPPPDVASHLSITVNAPTLVCTFTLADDADEILEWARIYLHPNEASPREVVNLKTGQLLTDFTL